MKKYYEFRDAKSAKFWEFTISENSSEVHLRYGKIGTDGRTQAKSFPTYDEALSYAEATAASKVKKGYALGSSSDTLDARANEVSSAKKASPAKKSSAAKKASPAKKEARGKQPLAPDIEALDALLISPDLKNRALGLTMLSEGNPEDHVSALYFLARGMKQQNEYMLSSEELAERTKIAEDATCIVKTLKKLPKDIFSYGEQYVKYIFDDGREPVIRAVIEENLAYNRDGDLRISDARLQELPDCIADYKDIHRVHLHDSAFKVFPPQVLKLPNVKYLNLYASKITEIPEELFNVDMHCAEFERNKLTRISPSIAKWKNLHTLNLYVNPIAELPDEVVLLPLLRRLRVEKTEMPGAQVEKLFAYLCDTEASDTRRLVQWNLVFARIERAKQLGNYAEWVAALDSSVPLVRANAALCIELWLGSGAPKVRSALPKDGDVLAVIGKLTIKTGELKERLGELGIKVVSKIDKNTTHLAIGEKPAKKLQDAVAWEGPVLTDSRVVGLLQSAEKPFLLDDSQETAAAQENLGALLASQDDESVHLALTMMKTSGVPNDMKTDLFATYQLSGDKKNKKLAKELLLQVASPSLTQVLAKRQNFVAATEKKISEYVATFCEDGELDANRLVMRLLGGPRLGVKYALEHGDSAMRLHALQSLVDAKGDLDLYDRHVKAIPEEIGDVEGLVSLRWDHAGGVELPASIGKQVGLRSLRLGGNRLKALPAELANLTALEFLDIGGNKFKEVPPEIAAYGRRATIGPAWLQVQASLVRAPTK